MGWDLSLHSFFVNSVPDFDYIRFVYFNTCFPIFVTLVLGIFLIFVTFVLWFFSLHSLGERNKSDFRYILFVRLGSLDKTRRVQAQRSLYLPYFILGSIEIISSCRSEQNQCLQAFSIISMRDSGALRFSAQKCVYKSITCTWR